MLSSVQASENVTIVALAVLVPFLAILGWRRGKGMWWTLLRLALVTYAAAIVGQAFFPLPPWVVPPELESGPTYRPWPWPWVNIVPLATIRDGAGLGLGWQQSRYLVANVLAFMPVGVFVGLMRPTDHSWRRVLVTGTLVSAVIETTQLLLSLLIGYPYRVVDVDDLILNTVGTLTGYLAFVTVDRVARSVLPERVIFWAGSRVRSAS